MSIASTTNTSRVSVVRVNNAEKPLEVGNKRIKPPTVENVDDTIPTARNFAVTVHRVRKVPKLETADESQETDPDTSFQNLPRVRSTSSPKTGRVSVIKLPRDKTPGTQRTHCIDVNLHEQEKKRQSEGIFSNTKSGPVNPNIVHRLQKSSIGDVSVLKVKKSANSVKPMTASRKISPLQAGGGINAGNEMAIVKTPRKRAYSS
jgi:hypothetical protein